MAFFEENAQLLAATHAEFIRGVEDGITEENVLLNLLESRGRVMKGMSGTHLEWRVRKQANTTVTDWRGMDEIDFVRENSYDTAKLNWKGYAGSYTVEWWHAQANKGRNQIFDLQKEELLWLRSDIMEKMEDGAFDDGTADNGKGFEGLEAFVKATGTYANISQTNAYWAAQVVAGNAGPNTSFATDAIERMATAFVQAGRGGSTRGKAGQIHCWITDRDTWVIVHSKIQTNERFGYAADKNTAEAGFENILVMGRPMYWSDSATATKMYGKNLDTIELACTTRDLLVPDSKLLLSPKSFVGTVVSMANLRCTSPRYNVVITNTNT